MIPIKGCDPEINIVSLGAEILERLMFRDLTLDEVVSEFPTLLSVSIDHVILALDWLYVINAILFTNGRVLVNEAQ